MTTRFDLTQVGTEIAAAKSVGSLDLQLKN